RADRRGPRLHVGVRRHGRRAGARRRADGHHRHRPFRRHLHVHGRRRPGQREEVHRGRPPRRQGLRGPQGGGGRRHGRRPVQGHGRPGGEPAHQDHQHRGTARRASDGVTTLRAILAKRAAAAALFLFGAPLALLLAGCAQLAPRDEPGFAPSGPLMVAAAHPLTVDTGMTVLRLGGSAVDAAVAVQAVLGLVEPQSSGIGGGAFMLYWSEQEKKLRAYDGRETAPAAARPARFLDAQGRPLDFVEAVESGRSVGVPGVLRLLELAHERHGRLRWAENLRYAIYAAEEGFPMPPRLHAALERNPHLRDDPYARRIFYDRDGRPKAVGERVVNPAYGATLNAIALQGASAFYQGAIAQDIVRAVRSHARPGDLTEEDLLGYRAKEREPLCGPYRVWRVCSMPPPSSGGVALLQILGLLERTAFAERPAHSAEAVHLFAEASRL